MVIRKDDMEWMSKIQSELLGKSAQPFVVTPHSHPSILRIRTPFPYPRGGRIDMFCYKDLNGEQVLGDLGEATGWFRTRLRSLRPSEKQIKCLATICVDHGVELYKGALEMRLGEHSDLAESVSCLAQIMYKVASLIDF